MGNNRKFAIDEQKTQIPSLIGSFGLNYDELSDACIEYIKDFHSERNDFKAIKKMKHYMQNKIGLEKTENLLLYLADCTMSELVQYIVDELEKEEIEKQFKELDFGE